MVQAEIWRLLGNNGDRVPFQVANGSTINTGDFLELADNMTVTAHSTNVDTPIVGIAAHDKVASDGHLFITGITNCIFKATILSGGTSTIGDLMSMGNAAGEINVGATADFEKGFTVGFAYTDGAAGHTTFVRSTF
jgi:hypothetical protein